MSIIRRRSDNPQKVGVKKIASVSSGESTTGSSINLNPGPKTTLVSGIVDQLIKSGYKGNLMTSAGMSYAQPDMSEEHKLDNHMSELQEDLKVRDIDFENQEAKKPEQEPKEMSATELRRKNATLLEERTKNSQDKIENISKSARVLYGHIDTFISALRVAADDSRDNQRLGNKLENLRRMCVGFVKNMEQQMPHYATSLFVNLEDEEDGR